MTVLAGSFNAPGVSAALSYPDNGGVYFSLTGIWSRALIVAEASTDGGKTWAQIGNDHGLSGMPALATADPVPGWMIERSISPGKAGLVRLRCAEWNSGWCQWRLYLL